MNSQKVCNNDSGKRLNLPEPDPDNITVLTRNLPNTPILPWHHYDSPWNDAEAENPEESDILDTNEMDEGGEELLIDATEKTPAENLEPLETADIDEELSEQDLVTQNELPATLELEESHATELNNKFHEEELTERSESSTTAQLKQREISDEDESSKQDLFVSSEEPSETAAHELKQLG